MDIEAHPLLNEWSISDYHLARVIDHLGRAHEPENTSGGLFRVDYRDLAIQHLGSVYEGMLELKPVFAVEDMYVVSRRVQGKLVEEYWPKSKGSPTQGRTLTGEICKQGTIYLETEKGERRASGSYYTPDHIVEYIVENTLGPLCNRLSVELEKEIQGLETLLCDAGEDEREELESRLLSLQVDYDDRVLRLKVLDPAMGSGHFLIRACQFLAEEIATHRYTGDKEADMLDGESAVSFWKRKVVENCLYGVDKNGLAVELAKLALWLETVSATEPLSFLDHHIRVGDSLVGAELGSMRALPNDPELWSEESRSQMEEKISGLLEKLEKIEATGSETAELVKEKGKIYRDVEKEREPYRVVGDFWCSAFSPKSKILSTEYQEAVSELGRPRRFKKLMDTPWAMSALKLSEKEYGRCFHWELEYPEVFFERGEVSNKSGFDAVIGNPPYDVISELETGRDLRSFKEFINASDIYSASKKGKNNLYKLFVCRSLDVLRSEGYLGLITPMAILGDQNTSLIRRKMVNDGEFIAIEAFPQKDDLSKRVFAEAKLSTVIFVFKKTNITAEATCLSRIHPENFIQENSPSLAFSSSDIELYDSDNYTIVSCSQADWDLAVRIMGSGRLVRLKDYVGSFQGEVNETNEKKRGVVSDFEAGGTLILRGSNVCLYTIREASQGEDLYLRVDDFFEGKSSTSKAFHSKERRVGFQRSSPQNNFRRIVASLIEQDNYCFDTVSYVPESHSSLPLEFVLALLNSKLADWYFRLGSTNSKVNEYQFDNLPCPVFAEEVGNEGGGIVKEVIETIDNNDVKGALDMITPLLESAPFPWSIVTVACAAADRIIKIELHRGKISRSARSALDLKAQPYQDFIDNLFYRIAGLSDEEVTKLEGRLSGML